MGSKNATPKYKMQIGTLESLFNPSDNDCWRITDASFKPTSDELFCDDFKQHARVSVIGPYKSGKSTLIARYIGSLSLGDEVKNTKGIDVYESALKNDKIFIMDSEGLYQPMDKGNALIKEEFIMDFIMDVSNIIIMVFDKLTTNDFRAIEKIHRTLNGLDPENKRLSKVIILHNARTIEKESNLIIYKDNLQREFDGEPTENKLMFDSYLGKNRNGKTIRHIVVGNKNKLRKIYEEGAMEIESQLKTPKDVVDVEFSILSSVCNLISKRYVIEYGQIAKLRSKKRWLDSKKDCIIKLKEGLISCNMKLELRPYNAEKNPDLINYYFVDTKQGMESKPVRFTLLVIESGGIVSDSLLITVEDDGLITLTCDKVRLDDSKNAIKIFKEIISPYPIGFFDDMKMGDAITVKQNLLIFKIPVSVNLVNKSSFVRDLPWVIQDRNQRGSVIDLIK